ncbi:MAG: ABC transporter substrate-binding protein [Firmicutes bacterium]|nr:ABC transporter substrate-binding protein [Bacillota bacterium]
MKKTFGIFIMIAVLAIVFTACIQTGQEPAAEPLPVIIYDREGFPVTLPSQLDRIISIGPSNTEVLVELGFGGQVIATDTFSGNVPGIQPGISIFNMMALDLEHIIYLNPDIVFVTGMTRVAGDNDPLSVVSDMGITVIYMPSSASIADIKKDIMFMATVVDELDKGNALVANMSSQLDRIRTIGKTITDKRTVYFEISPAPHLVSFGAGTFLHEMIELVGAINILGEQSGWIAVSDEFILEANPDVILTSVNFIDNPIGDIVDRPGWDVVTAVQNNDVFIICTDSSNRPSHNIIRALMEIAEAVYPGKFLRNGV